MRKDAQARSPKNCSQCGASFVRGHRTKEQWAQAHFCSVKCSTESHKGVARPDAVLILAENRKEHRGEKHWNWQGGITPQLHLLRKSEQYNAWRKAVYARDYWTCQECGVKQKQPVAHHIKNFRDFPDLRFTVSNGKTLCRGCHKRTHAEIGASTRFALAA